MALIGKDALTPYTGGSGSGAVNTNAAVSPVTAFAALGVKATYNDGTDVASAVAAAKAADVAIVFGSAHSGEGHDRDSLNLEDNIDALIPQVALLRRKCRI